MDLAQKVHSALHDPAPDGPTLNLLLQELAQKKETDALVRLWDIRGSKKIDAATWDTMKKLHDRGKGKLPTGSIIIPADRRRLPPARRLHKIMNGRIMSERSDLAKEMLKDHMPDVVKYLEAHPDLKDKRRSKQIGILRKAMSIDHTMARGLVTTLKLKRFLVKSCPKISK